MNMRERPIQSEQLHNNVLSPRELQVAYQNAEAALQKVQEFLKITHAYQRGERLLDTDMEDAHTVIPLYRNRADARAVLDRGGSAVRLSYDYKPGDTRERERINSAGGTFSRSSRELLSNGFL